MIRTLMPSRKQEEKARPRTSTAVRATITFPHELYATLEQLARQKKVSLAWVVRDATEQYLVQKRPLFGKQE